MSCSFDGNVDDPVDNSVGPSERSRFTAAFVYLADHCRRGAPKGFGCAKKGGDMRGPNQVLLTCWTSNTWRLAVSLRLPLSDGQHIDLTFD